MVWEHVRDDTAEQRVLQAYKFLLEESDGVNSSIDKESPATQDVSTNNSP